jgi:hypothetical protein
MIVSPMKKHPTGAPIVTETIIGFGIVALAVFFVAAALR